MGIGVGDQQTRVSLARAVAGLLVPGSLAASSAVLMWAASAPTAAVRAPGPAPVDALLSLGAALVCAGLLAWAALGATFSLAAALTGQVAGRLDTVAGLLTPRVVRAAIGCAVGVAVVGGQVAGPALGVTAGGVARPMTNPVTSSAEPAGATPGLRSDWSPDRPAAPPTGLRAAHPVGSQARNHGQGGQSRTADRVPPVVVQRGDTLWAIAAHHLGPAATDAEVAAEWPRWQAANRSTIGADPDLIVPGQRLEVPPSRDTPSRNTPSRPAPTRKKESP